MAEDYCELMDMPASMCAHCRGHGRAPEEQAEREIQEMRAKLLRTDPRWFPAQYAGTCGGCGTRFSPNTLIRQPEAPDFSWVAECCA